MSGAIRLPCSDSLAAKASSMIRARLPIHIAAIRFALALASLIAGALHGAEAAPRTLVTRSGDGAKIALYDSLCDEDNHLECLIAEIGCESPGDFTATLFALDNKEAAALFAAKGAGKGSVTAGGASQVLQLTKVALSEYSYKWNATLISYERGREIWGAIWGADSVQLQAGAKKASLARADMNEGSFREVVSACAAAR